MTIRVYPVKIEAFDDDDECVFTIEAFDEYLAKIEIKALVGTDNIEEVITHIRQGIALLELKSGEAPCGDGL